MGAKLCALAQIPSSMSWRLRSFSHSGSGAVMTTSHRSRSFIDVRDSLTAVQAVRVQHEVQGALGADRSVVGRVPAHEDLVVPQAKLAAPVVAAFFHRQA